MGAERVEYTCARCGKAGKGKMPPRLNGLAVCKACMDAFDAWWYEGTELPTRVRVEAGRVVSEVRQLTAWDD